MNRLWPVIFMLIISINCWARNSFALSNTSIGVQRLNLEQTIRLKISSVLDSIISKDAYTIDIKITTSDPQRPSWYKRDGDTGEDRSKDVENESDENKIRFIDNSLPADEGNVIIFDKLGLEAPLIDDFNDFYPDGKITLTMEGSSKKKKAEKKVAFADQFWRLQNAIDIFNNLQSVSIEIGLSASLSVEIRNKIEEYIKRINFNLGKVTPKIKFKYILLGHDIKNADLFTKVWKGLELFSKYATFFGLVLSMLLFAFAANKLIEKYFKLAGDKSSSDSMNIDMMPPEKEDKDEVGANLPGAPIENSTGIVGFDGLRRFREYREISPNDAVILVKRWLAEQTEQGIKSLKALVQRMEMKELEEIFVELDTSEKKKWQSLINTPLNGQDLAVANDYISNQIVQNIILPSYLDDKEVFAMIYQLTPDQVVELITNNSTIGAALVNVLNTNFVMNVFAKCSSEMKISLVDKAMELKPEDITSLQDRLKAELIKYVTKGSDRPFFDKITALLPTTVDINFENHLYNLLVQEKAFEVIEKMSNDYFPASLIPELPETIIKELLQNYPLQSKVKLFLTLDDDLRDELLAIFAPAGTKAHDMLEMEFENIRKNEQEYNRVLSTKDEYWTDFVEYVRKRLKSNKLYHSQVQSLVSEWREGMLDGKSNGSLKLVA